MKALIRLFKVQLKGKNGKYHAIYSLWLKSRGYHGWVTHSEVAHAVSDKLTGPY